MWQYLPLGEGLLCHSPKFDQGILDVTGHIAVEYRTLVEGFRDRLLPSPE
jgi:hypothetical protein